MRKTVSIKKLIEQVNKFNATSADEYKAEREGKNMFLESILHDAGVYCGFSYLEARELSEDAMSVGIREQYPNGRWNFTDTDNTRLRYTIHGRL